MTRADKASIWCAEIRKMLDKKQTAAEAIQAARRRVKLVTDELPPLVKIEGGEPRSEAEE